MAATSSESFAPPPAAPMPLSAASLPGNEISTTMAPVAEATKNENWRFVEPQPIREDQVDNAVKFLSHPKVKGSPIMYRRSFLERKGLSKEEIDEAFRRVPDPPSDSSSGTLPAAGVQSTAVAVPQHVSTSVMQPAKEQLAVARTESISWAQRFLALGVLTAAGAGAGVLTQKYFLPKFKHWLRSLVLGESAPVDPGRPKKLTPVEEVAAQAAAAAAAAATAASQVSGAIQEMTHFRSEDRQRLDNIVRAVEAQTLELKNALAGMKDAASNSEITKNPRSVPISSQVNGFDSMDHWKGIANGSRPSSASEIRGDKALRAPNAGSMTEYSSGHYNIGQQVRSSTMPPPNGPTQAPHSQSYMDVIAMLERGEKPPNIREVNDKPPNPNQPPSNPRLQPRPKPWENSGSEARPLSPIYSNEAELQLGRYIENRNVASNVGYNSTVRIEAATTSSGTVGSPEPWWRKKPTTNSGTGGFPEPGWRRNAEPEVLPSTSSVKVTEVDPDTGNEISTAQVNLPSSSSFQPNGGRSGWVPPSVPQPMYPGAHEAIRRPKPAMGAALSSLRHAVEGESSSGSASASGVAPLPPPSPAENEEVVVGVPGEVATSSEQPIAPPEQHGLAPLEREPEHHIEQSSVVEPNPTFKDVVNVE